MDIEKLNIDRHFSKCRDFLNCKQKHNYDNLKTFRRTNSTGTNHRARTENSPFRAKFRTVSMWFSYDLNRRWIRLTSTLHKGEFKDLPVCYSWKIRTISEIHEFTFSTVLPAKEQEISLGQEISTQSLTGAAVSHATLARWQHCWKYWKLGIRLTG